MGAAQEKTAEPVATNEADDKIIASVESDIDRAFALAEDGKIIQAVDLFGKVRDFANCEEMSALVDILEEQFRATVTTERDKFHNYVRQGNMPQATRKTVILADSLGLPRPGEPLNVVGNDATSYAFALREANKRLARSEDVEPMAVEPICERYATSETVLRNMDLVDLKDADVVVHVGLNDFSRRIFMERQRLSLKLLPTALSQKIVRFSQVNYYRSALIKHFDDYCYVSREQWAANISALVKKAKAKGARSVTWLTIIQLPLRVEAHTPGYRYNVLNYNLQLYQDEKKGNIHLLDVDRLFWERGIGGHMHEDAMHLSKVGHLCVCNRLVERFYGLESYTVKEAV